MPPLACVVPYISKFSTHDVLLCTDVRTWSFNPPGGLVTRNLNKVLDTFCTSLVVGKDAVSRGTVNNLSRLMDEMVTALARCRCVPCPAESLGLLADT